jgi:hypothetical protein
MGHHWAIVVVEDLGSAYRLRNDGHLLYTAITDNDTVSLQDDDWNQVTEVLRENQKMILEVMQVLGGEVEVLPKPAPLTLQELKDVLLDAYAVALRFHINMPSGIWRAVKLQEDGFGAVGPKGERLFINLPPSPHCTYDEATQTTYHRGKPVVSIQLL